MNIISIKALVDVVAVLSNNHLEKNAYFMDTNKLNGSSNEGSMHLETAVDLGDIIIWTCYGLEVESYVQISNIDVNEKYMTKPKQHFYEGTNIPYWQSSVTKVPEEQFNYVIHFEVGNTTTYYAAGTPSIKPGNNTQKS
jgi:hypothetical protein